jgi:Mg-chelatase subunit ChlD
VLRSPDPLAATSAWQQNAVATNLEKAKYRDRDVTEAVRSEPPGGRLRARAMVQGAAMRERGIMQQPEPWERKVRKQTDEPTLNVGVLVDISGSMGWRWSQWLPRPTSCPKP